jgi:dUTP pyrophosphatase
MNIEINFTKTHPDAKLPSVNHSDRYTGDAGADIRSIECVTIPARGSAVVGVGLKLASVTPGYWFRIEGRSGLGFKHGISPHFGIIDNGYRGDLAIKLYNQTDTDYEVKCGDAIAQMIVYQMNSAEFCFVEEASESDRGEKGFGSSGK